MVVTPHDQSYIITMKKTEVCCLLLAICLVVGIVLVGIGVAGFVLRETTLPSLIEGMVNKRVTIQPGHATYEQLQGPTLPIWKSIYFFNLTNGPEFEDGKEIPHIVEVGPYSYRETRTKEFQEFSEDQDQLTYNQSKLFHFDESASEPGLNESDIICTINIPFVTGAYQVLGDSIGKIIERQLFKLLVSMTGSHLYTCQNATAMAWGYSDGLIRGLNNIGKYPRRIASIQVNASTNDSLPSKIYTGVDDITKIAQFIQWNGHYQNTNTWPNGKETGANAINGTEGLFFRPNLKEGDNLTAFIDDIQRSIDIKYVGQVNYIGMKTFRFEVENSTFLSAFNYPENSRWGSWCPDGLFYLGPTQYPELPVFGSKAHFLDGDPLLLDGVEGLEPPNRTLHDITVDVEPTTGATVQLKQILQVNVQVNRTKEFKQLENIQGFNGSDALYYPVLWISEHAELTPEFKQYLESKGLSELNLVTSLAPVIIGIILSVGVVMVLISLVGFVLLIRHSMKRKDGENSPLL